MTALVPEIIKLLLSKETRESASLVLSALKQSKDPKWKSDIVVFEESFKYNQENECSVLVSFVAKLLASKEWDEHQIEIIRFASSELIRNAFVHGLKTNRRGKVRIRIITSADFFEINLKDPGKGFGLQDELVRQGADDVDSRLCRALAMIYRSITTLSQEQGRNSVRAVLKRGHKPPDREQREDIIVFTLRGNLEDLARSSYYFAEILDNIEKTKSRILIDLSEAVYVGSNGIGLLTKMLTTAGKTKDDRWRIAVCASGKIWRLFHAIGFTTLNFPFFESKENAEGYLKNVNVNVGKPKKQK